jgi:hypothetical protein
MYRIKFYYHNEGFAEDALTMIVGTTFTSLERANKVFDQLKAEFGRKMTGGDIEQEVPGIGWVLLDDVESVLICARRRESECGSD